MGIRAGFVYKTEDDLITNNYQLERGLSAYTVPFRSPIAAITCCSGDDKTITLYGIPTASAAVPDDQYVTNLLRTATTRPTRSR